MRGVSVDEGAEPDTVMCSMEEVEKTGREQLERSLQTVTVQNTVFSSHCSTAASLSTQNLFLCEAASDIFCSRCFTRAANHSFLFTDIIAIFSKCLIRTLGDISIQNRDYLIYKKLYCGKTMNRMNRPALEHS